MRQNRRKLLDALPSARIARGDHRSRRA